MTRRAEVVATVRGCRRRPCDVSLRPVAFLIYYDFTSPESFALNEVVGSVRVMSEVEWRGVQVDPSLPVPMHVLDRRARGRVEAEVADMMRAVAELRMAVPNGRPNTRRALQAVVSVERMHESRAGEFRTLLFRAYWWDGADLSDLAVLRQVAEQAGVPPWVELEHQAAQSTQVAWELQWQAERLGGVPRALRGDGQILWGVKSEQATRAFFAAITAGD